jgi:sulfhydrogenase subunit alpha
MHSSNFDLEIKNISKIEGHTHLDLKVKDNKVKRCRLKIAEGKRFFSNAAVGLKYDMLTTTMSRICGTCSSAHALCSIEALEKILDIDKKITKQTRELRDLLAYSNHLRDHAMHLYFFCLPDVFEIDSVLDFPKNKHKWIHDGLHVKDAGNYLSTVSGGRAVHPPRAIIGGFTEFPTKKEVITAIKKLKDCRKRIIRVTKLFYNDKTEFTRKTNYVGLVSNNYSFLKGHIKTSKGQKIPEAKYGEHFNKVILPYATARGVKWDGKEFMTGSLARVNLNKQNLCKATKKDMKKYLSDFPCNDIFSNNLAQSIEMLECVDRSLIILQGFKKNGVKNEKILKIKPKAGTGVGVMEAPRGTLYYQIKLDKNGIVKKAELCIPTQQNIIHIEKDIAAYVEHLLTKKVSKNKISLEIEKMIRAYDPCMSCATHFLKVDWS